MNLLRLYPRAWRERYGDELEALMEDAPAAGFDLLKGAFAMRLKYLPGWAILASFAIAGWLTGFGSSQLVRQQWKSAAVLRMTPKGVVAANVGAQQAYDLASAQNELMRRIQADFTLPGVLIRPVPWPLLTPGYVPTLTFVVEYRCGDAAQANATVDQLIAKILPMRRAGLDIDVLDSPRQARGPIFPNRPLFEAIGIATGAILAMATLLARHIMRTHEMQTA